MLTHAEAKQQILETAGPLSTEECAFSELRGRVLAETIQAPHGMPLFDNSSVDGYAVRAADVVEASPEHPVSLKRLGYIPAGDSGDFELRQGECVQIATGAPLPQGADAVVMKEDCTASKAQIEVRLAVRVAENVRFQGEDIQAGEELLAPGQLLGASQLAVLATMGFPRVTTFRRLTASVVSTGSELLEIDQTPGPGQIRESNRFMLEALLLEEHCQVPLVTKAPDEETALRDVFEQALSCDLALISGGVSVGEKDLTKRVLEEMGVEGIFWKVRVKPGKPLFFGRRGETIVFGLPGNPASSFVLFEEFVRPALRQMQGRSVLEEPMVSATLEDDLRESANRMQFLRAQVRFAQDRYWVRPLPMQGSHSISSLVRGNALIRVEPDSGIIPAGTSMPVRLLQNEI